MLSSPRLHFFLTVTAYLLPEITAFGLFCGNSRCSNSYSGLYGRNEYPIASFRIFASSSKIDCQSIQECEIPSLVTSPVLTLVYPAMMEHLEEFGNPNIPLGCSDGKRCQTLRRLAFQSKLSEDEVELLAKIGFRFNTLEDVYEEADFDDCLRRLLDYEAEFKTSYQIPKKYHPDPELGAWVTMIRRIGRDNIDATHRNKLDSIDFGWISTRKCGSAFMKNYRSIRDQLLSFCDQEDANDLKSAVVVDQQGIDSVLVDPDVKKWINAQRVANEKGNISAPRCEYLDDLPGFNWRQEL